MNRPESKDARIASYFWGSVLGFTVVLIIDIVFGLGLITGILHLFFPPKFINLKEPLNWTPKLILKKEDVIIPLTINDPFKDLMQFIDKPVPEKYSHIIVDRHHLDVESNPNLRQFLNISDDDENTTMDYFQNDISQHEMYPEDSKIVNRVLERLATVPFRYLYEKKGGTQFKLIIKYSKGYRALFKPMRTTREQQTAPDHSYYNDYERPNAEIAAFHLDRILGFRRAIPIVGRAINLTSELLQFSEDSLAATFYISPTGRVCVTGKCDVFCDTKHPTCGDPDMIEGSFAAFLPKYEGATRKSWRHPWRRSYSKRRGVEADENEQFCEKVKKVNPYSEGRRMLDIMDMAVYDFLIGNMDRHHYETFKSFKSNDTFTIHLDQGRSFSLPFQDEHSILQPIKQCCLIRRSTLETLLNFHTGPVKLSEALKESLKSDPLPDLLWEPHYDALNRRIPIILDYIRNCVKAADNP